jgi:hypothetical protein
MKAIDNNSNIVLDVAEAKGTGASGIKCMPIYRIMKL